MACNGCGKNARLVIVVMIEGNRMRHVGNWYRGWFRYLFFDKVFHKEEKHATWYLQRPYLERQEVNDQLIQLIEAGKPFMVSRLGAGETFAMRTYEFDHTKNKEKSLKQICDCAGFFPPEQEYAQRFLSLMKEALQDADMMGTALVPFDGYFMKKYMKKEAPSMDIGGAMPLFVENPWSRLLKGKKVLVVHPFAKTIQKQYAQREKLFPGTEILPEFELITYKAVQTSAGEVDERFADWFEALAFMENEIAQIEYDIALLGCGAYGTPLAAWIKRQGKQVVHIGGALQILFGIKGKRWDERPKVASIYNAHWCYADPSETPRAAGMVEGGCYWQ